jgi:hypothetical protein
MAAHPPPDWARPTRPPGESQGRRCADARVLFLLRACVVPSGLALGALGKGSRVLFLLFSDATARVNRASSSSSCVSCCPSCPPRAVRTGSACVAQRPPLGRRGSTEPVQGKGPCLVHGVACCFPFGTRSLPLPLTHTGSRITRLSPLTHPHILTRSVTQDAMGTLLARQGLDAAEATEARARLEKARGKAAERAAKVCVLSVRPFASRAS